MKQMLQILAQLICEVTSYTGGVQFYSKMSCMYLVLMKATHTGPV